MAVLRLGGIDMFKGDVTTLDRIGARPPQAVESMLGYGGGRLSDGYWVLLLKEGLTPDDFDFGGTTLRSGGRLGKPLSDTAADQARPFVKDQVITERGSDGYRDLKQRALGSVTIIGATRIAKVLPVRRHDNNLAPDKQYPMGGGALQWKLMNDKRFLMAMKVSPSLVAETPTFTVSLAENQPFQQLYDNRARVARYLASA